MTLQLSGCCGQRFAFHGYPPREIPERKAKILEMETRSRREGASQIWIEAPYKSGHMFDALREALQPRTVLCVAASLTTPQERVLAAIQGWIKQQGYPPTIRELARHFDVCIGTIQAHLRALERTGALTRHPLQARGLSPTQEVAGSRGASVQNQALCALLFLYGMYRLQIRL